MARILADHQYSISNFRSIDQINKYELEKKAAVFKRRPDMPRAKKQTITAEDWKAMRNFKTTKLDKNEDGIEKEIDGLRMLLNKLTASNYDDIRDKVIENLKKILASSATDADLNKVGESIFEIGSANKFWSKLYAKLYKDLLKEFPIMEPIYKNNFDSFISLFETIRFVPAEQDYDQFCAVNKENSKRRAISSFFMWLMSYEIIEPTKIIGIINVLKGKFLEYINLEDKKNEVHEIGENLVILIGTDSDILQDNCEKEFDSIAEFVSQVAAMKHKNFTSLTSKTVFKFMDLEDKC